MMEIKQELQNIDKFKYVIQMHIIFDIEFSLQDLLIRNVSQKFGIEFITTFFCPIDVKLWLYASCKWWRKLEYPGKTTD